MTINDSSLDKHCLKTWRQRIGHSPDKVDAHFQWNFGATITFERAGLMKVPLFNLIKMLTFYHVRYKEFLEALELEIARRQ